MPLFLGVLLLLVDMGSCANILAILPVPVKSHYVVMEPLLQALAARGHQLTVFSSFPQKVPLPNFTDIDCSQGNPVLLSNQDYNEVKALTSKPHEHIRHLLDLMEEGCSSYMKVPEFGHIKSKRFDLLITEMFGTDCFNHFAFILGVPLVSIVTMSPLPWAPDYFGLPDNPSYIPSSLVNLQPNMNLYQRMINTIFITYAKTYYHFYGSPTTQHVMEDYFQQPLPWVEDIARNSSLLLMNTHPSISPCRPLPPNVVEIGGIHIKQKQPLPKDLQDILDNSPQGVVLMSFGSMIRVSKIPKKIFNIILNSLSKIPQTVLMKYEEDLPAAPRNVIIRNWLPQRDILEHKNVLAFISHCGLASLMEAVYTATPVLGVPIFSDQYPNINILASKGAGVPIDLDNMVQNDFDTALDQILNNASYSKNMKRLSEQFRDRPMTALQSAVYWTEYVLRHRGAPHLRPASTSLPFYQLWLLDVIAVLLAALASALYAICCLSKYLLFVLKRYRSIKYLDSHKLKTN